MYEYYDFDEFENNESNMKEADNMNNNENEVRDEELEKAVVWSVPLDADVLDKLDFLFAQ